MTLTTFDFDKWLDLPAYRGQRVERFRFEWRNGLTDELYGYVHPVRDSPPPTLTHTTTQSIKRRLALSLGLTDTVNINPITDRICPLMDVGGTTWPLGRYMFTDETDLLTTAGSRGSFTLVDEGFAIDQELSDSYSSGGSVTSAVAGLVAQVAFVSVIIEPTEFAAAGAFTVGQTRGQALDAYTTQGDFFPYWMAHDGLFHMIRAFDPAMQIVDLDYDVNPRIRAASIAPTSDVLNAPNRFVVASNSGNSTAPVVGRYDVPPSAPHSIANRGFIIQSSENLQISSADQAAAMARNKGIRQTIYDRITFETPIDPRHDSYTVIRFAGSNWLELGWSMVLTPGGSMQHLARKAYT